MKHNINSLTTYSLKVYGNSVCSNKTLFSFLKSAKQDQTGSPPLQNGNGLATDTTENTDIHNRQFQSVFTTKVPLSLSRLCKMQVQDMANCGTLRHDAVSEGILNSNPKKEQFTSPVMSFLSTFKT